MKSYPLSWLRKRMGRPETTGSPKSFSFPPILCQMKNRLVLLSLPRLSWVAI
jgi:hypothetical protein